MSKVHHFPCLHCHPPTYIRMVHNLIERCLLLGMDREDCVKALAERASIHPLVTLTVWKELQKENKDFFHSYLHYISSSTPYTNRHFQGAPRFATRNPQRYWKNQS